MIADFITKFVSTPESSGTVKTSMWAKFISLFSGKPKEVHKGVQIVTVKEPLHYNAFFSLPGNDTITVIYDKESLDSLFGLSFLKKCYGEKVQAVAFQNVFSDVKEIKSSNKTYILGIDIARSDLLHLSNITNGVAIFNYRGACDYLYDPKVSQDFKDVTVYQADYQFFHGVEGLEALENSVAMMMMILYVDTPQWGLWSQNHMAMQVAHKNCFYAPVPAYGLKMSTITVTKGKQAKSTFNLVNEIDAMMFDFRNQLSAAADGYTNENSVAIYDLQPRVARDEHAIYFKRLQDHIHRTRTLKAFKCSSSWMSARYAWAYYVPALSFAVNDIFSLTSHFDKPVVCCEDLVDHQIFYIYSKDAGRASVIANGIRGEQRWVQGPVVCVKRVKPKSTEGI